MGDDFYYIALYFNFTYFCAPALMVVVGIGVIPWSHIRAQSELSFEDIYLYIYYWFHPHQKAVSVLQWRKTTIGQIELQEVLGT